MDIRINRRQIVLLIADAFLIAAASYIGLLLRFDFELVEPFFSRTNDMIFYIITLRIIVNYLFGLYRPLWKYASIYELVRVVTAVSFGSVIILLASHLMQSPFSRSSYLIAWILNILFIGGIRFALRIFPLLIIQRNQATSRVLIIGAGAAGTIVVKELRTHFNTEKKLPVGFIDDDPAKQHRAINGVKVLGSRGDIPDIILKHSINEVVIAIPSASRNEIKTLTRILSQIPIKINIIPSVNELINGNVTISKIRPVQIEDLLGREEVKTDLCEIAQYLQNEIVLVTGAGGSIGSELCRQVLNFAPQQLILLDHSENNIYDCEMELLKNGLTTKIVPIVADVRDAIRIDNIFSIFTPTVIFHAAAHKHVPLMEANREEAINNNVFGTKNVAEAADRYKAKCFLLVSTDKAVNPTSVMGATKRMAEITLQMIAKRSKTRFCAVRFGNVLGSRGSVIPLFKKQIEAGGPVTVTDEKMTRYFMTIPEAASLLIQAAAMGNEGEIFILDMGEPVKIIDLAHDLIRLSGFEPDKDIRVEYCGLRPGEKLYEELFTTEEGIKATKNQHIFVSDATDMNSTVFVKELQHLSKVLRVDVSNYRDKPESIIQHIRLVK